PQQGSLQLQTGMQLSARNIRGPNLIAAPLHAHSQQPLTLNWHDHELNAASVQLQLDGSAIQLADQHYRFQSVAAAAHDLHVDLNDPLAATTQATFQLDGLTAPLGPYRTQKLGISADLQLAQKAARGHWQLSTPVEGLTLRGDFRHDLKSGSGMLTAQLAPFLFLESGRYLPKLLEHWSHPFDLSGGRLGFNARARWGAALKAEADIDIQNLAGFYDMNVFKDLTIHPTLTYADGTVTMPTAHLALNEVNVGFPVTQLQCDVAAQLPEEFRVSALSASLLGGHLTQPELHYRRHEKESRATWRFEGLQLGELVALEQNVEGNGVLDGELPVVLNSEGIAIADGEFHARAPGGIIRYRGELPQSTLATVPALQLTLDSLKNFHYQMLDVRADYAPSGDLELGVGLRGRNPDLDEPRPVQFNLTIRENIPELLRSLQLSRDIGDKLEQRIQEFYQHQQQETP
ncbi:MAG TPA: YdbH domain-containing protein, partial [Spongiibacteraceae bacterium]|nr:YdbH domain-containing protein [Spongiibacteraceae bacterium]